MRKQIAASILVMLVAAAGLRAEALPQAERAWREDRVARLTAADGWLTLIGLHFLREGKSTVGRAPENDVVLGAGPLRLGTVDVSAEGKIVLTMAPGEKAEVDGREVREVELQWVGPSAPTRLTFGTVTLFAIERGGRRALRVKDAAARRRREFAGLEYFPMDPAWRITAQWRPFAKPRLVSVANILGQVSDELVAGEAVFEREGRRIALLAIDEGPDAPLFFVISDGTSGRSTYGGGRHLYAPRPDGDTLVLDFNRAENPPCAFTPFSTCPVPPKENRLPFAVTAGERSYRGGPE